MNDARPVKKATASSRLQAGFGMRRFAHGRRAAPAARAARRRAAIARLMHAGGEQRAGQAEPIDQDEPAGEHAGRGAEAVGEVEHRQRLARAAAMGPQPVPRSSAGTSCRAGPTAAGSARTTRRASRRGPAFHRPGRAAAIRRTSRSPRRTLDGRRARRARPPPRPPHRRRAGWRGARNGARTTRRPRAMPPMNTASTSDCAYAAWPRNSFR